MGTKKMSQLTDLCPDFLEWPESWKGFPRDLEYGRQLLESLMPFAEFLAASDLTKKTIKRHLSNLWLLGGEIIREVNQYKAYSIPADDKLKESVGPDGGPYCRHLESDGEISSFDNTCRKLHKFLKGS
jgi:hypothetical protein